MQELAFVLNHKKRNLAVARIVSQLKGNSLVLFTRIEHGQWLFKKIQELTKGVNKVFYIDGSISAEEREDIRAQFERSGECIGVASIQVFGIGINIKQLHNIVLTSGGKSKIRLLQAIGRGLRLHPSKQILNVIDIVDDLKFKKSNFLLQHFRERVRYYENEKFPYVNIEVKME
jgi:superfamily II DNA or RNA helicase